MSSFFSIYAELHCRSNFSFLQGASHPDELVERAAELGYAALAITDECSLAGVVRAHVAAKKQGLLLIIGSEVTLSCSTRLVLLATNRNGYGNLSELITLGRRRAQKGSYTLHRSDFAAQLPDCLAILVPARDADVREQAAWLARTFPDRAWLGVALLLGADDALWLERLTTIAQEQGLPLVATGDVLMHVRSRKPLQDTLTAIRLGKSIAECGFDLQPNAEQHLRARLRLAQLYPSALLQETVSIAKRCTFSLDELRYEYPEEIVPSGETMTSYLRRLVYEGATQRRFPKGIPENIRQQIEYELTLIGELHYEPYFLTVYDIVRFARSQGILCQGRGSAANSVVCYCLGITEVDPSRSNVLFERFISRERNEPPDIDVDFEHQRREEVMQYIYGKYGRHRAALTASLITYRPRSAMKDVGKALGLDFDQINRLSQSHKWWDGKSINEEQLREEGFDPESPVVQKLIALTNTLVGFPRHLSQHTGGFVIARDNLSRLVPIENAAMKDRSVIEWDKDDLDALHLLKVDVLALGMLSAIRRSLEMISQRRGRRVDMQDILKNEDPQVYQMISDADTIGVFQIESRAQMSMLPRLRPKKYYDLVVQVAIVRPGPIQGNMVHPYLKQRHMDPKDIPYPGPEVEDVLKRTCGVPIFQEQVMQIAMLAAGYSTDDADDLRRSMAAWKRKGNLEKHEQKLKDGFAKRGYSSDFVNRLLEQIKGFGDYGFPEAHAASFALLAYVSAWIKYHEPAAFLAGLLNAQPMGFYSPSQLVQDAKRHGIEVRAIDVTVSEVESSLEELQREPAVRLGLDMINGLSLASAKRIVAVREERAFTSVDDLARRAALDQRELDALARANALLPMVGHRRQAKWEVAGMASPPVLLKDAPIVEAPLHLPKASEGQEIIADYASIGLTLNRHPLALLRSRLKEMRLSTALEMKRFGDRQLARTTGIVTMRQRPPTASGVMFVTLEDETGYTNVIIWEALLLKQRKEILNAHLLTVYGIWQRQDNVCHLVAKRVVDHSPLLGRLTVESRDFR